MSKSHPVPLEGPHSRSHWSLLNKELGRQPAGATALARVHTSAPITFSPL